MTGILTLLNSSPYIDFPHQLAGWLGWLIFLAILILGVRYWWEMGEPWDTRNTLILIVLAICIPITALFFGLRLPVLDILPVPGLPIEPSVPGLMFLASLPWVLAGGILGPFQAVLLGSFSGLFTAFWETHSIFTPLETAGLALLFSVAVRQRYRSPFFRFLRHPLGAAFVLAIAYSPVYILTALVNVQGSIAARLDYALTQTYSVILSRGLELIISGLIAEVIFLTGAKFWGRQGELEPSPAESSLQLRFLGATIPLVALLVITLTVVDWTVAGNSARRMIEERLSSTAQAAAESLPYFLETGQNIIINLADTNLLSQPEGLLPGTLAKGMRTVPFFKQLSLFDINGNPVSGYPEKQADQLQLSPEEKRGIELALKGVLIQTYTLAPWQNEDSAQVSFIAGIRDVQGQVQGVLLGRTDLNSNPFTQPVVESLKRIKKDGGTGIILDDKQQILYHSVVPNSLIMTKYVGIIPTTPKFFTEVSPTGSRSFVYYQPVVGKPWSVILTLPAEQTQQLALGIAIPLLGMVLFLTGFAVVALQLGIRSISSTLSGLAQEAANIAQGDLDNSMQVKGIDEVGRLSKAFEQMRVGLKARLEELNKLLVVSQGVAATLEVKEAIQPVLDAALGKEVTAARVILIQDVAPDAPTNQPVALGAGQAADDYAYLDGQIFEMMRQQDVLSISNTARIRRLNIPQTGLRPGALLALALHRENYYYGAMWIAYDHPHNFSEEEVRFLITLAGEAVLAASNARLYANAEIGRQRLEAVLDSTPEPVVVIDEKTNVLILNPAAVQVSGLFSPAPLGKPIQEAITHADLLNLLVQPTEERLSSREITLHNGRIYYASVSPVVVEGHPVGKVCILRDITHYKQLDSLKSEFVSTVSHDLRSPLTLMRGYATMLQMVGDLNEQQKTYANKIVLGVENMTRMVNNLLDLGRIEAGVGLQIEKVTLGEVISQVVNSLQPQAVQKNIQLEYEIHSDLLVTIDADRALIQQAVYNLVENAVKYTSSGGEVKVSMRVSPSDTTIEVRDTGIGIAPLDLPHMFEKFYRSGRREAYQQRGTGLGLAIVRSIAERHGGKVWVESQLGKGSTFYIMLPFHQATAVISEKAK